VDLLSPWMLQERVIGQADAVSAVSRAMKRARTGLKDPRRPIATMLFAGPTGVGKTELTKASTRAHPLPACASCFSSSLSSIASVHRAECVDLMQRPRKRIGRFSEGLS
jgi:hypothetical protein